MRGPLAGGLWWWGGGSSVNEVPIDTTPPVNGADQALADNTAYSSARNGSLPGATEAAAVTHHSITLGGQTIAYTARAGHLIAREPVTARAQAAFFYVAYSRRRSPGQSPGDFLLQRRTGLIHRLAAPGLLRPAPLGHLCAQHHSEPSLADGGQR